MFEIQGGGGKKILNADNKKGRRLFDTFHLIKSGKATTKIEIADALGVKSVDTVKNYIRELNTEFGTDIYMKRREGTYHYVIENEGKLEHLKTNLKLNPDDVIIIISSLIQSQASMETKMAIIKENLLGFLPEADRRKFETILQFEKEGKNDSQEFEKNITKIREAITDEKKISFSYRNGKGELNSHKVIPYAFACDLGKYYLISKPDNKDYLINYRIDRMRLLRRTDEKGKRSPEFNLNDYLKRTWSMYGGAESRVLVKFNKECKVTVTERNMSDGRIVEEVDDYFIYEFISNGTFGIQMWLMGFGANAEVLEPVELRDGMRTAAENMVRRYGKS